MLFKARSAAMLVLSRKVGQRVWIGDEISVTVVRIGGGVVRLGIEAPPHMPVARQELRERMDAIDRGGEEDEVAAGAAD
jgi:carbon storage regulator